ncbi:hypothetical protein GBA52_022739 [Prunus armeniaca]|nr:hypothetical protein GBA52_022739 [Prunus armeniaca]
MEKWWLLALLLLSVIPIEAGFGVGGGVGVNVGPVAGGGGAGVWIGGGINGNGPNAPSGSSASGLDRAYTALQAWKSAISEDPSKILDTWVGSDVCSYKGVFCADSQYEVSAASGPVVAGIDLNHANLKGTLVKELSFSH